MLGQIQDLESMGSGMILWVFARHINFLQLDISKILMYLDLLRGIQTSQYILQTIKLMSCCTIYHLYIYNRLPGRYPAVWGICLFQFWWIPYFHHNYLLNLPIRRQVIGWILYIHLYTVLPKYKKLMIIQVMIPHPLRYD